MSGLAERLREADDALAALGISDERISEIRARIQKSPVRFEALDGALAELDIDLPAPAPPRASMGPGAAPGSSAAPRDRSSAPLSEESLFGDASMPEGTSPFDEVRISEPPATVASAPSMSDSSDLASLLEGDDDVLIVGGGAMALSFDETPASTPPAEAASEPLEIESGEVEVLDGDDFELLVDDSSIVAPEGEPAEVPQGEDPGEGEEIDEATGQKKGFFRKLFS